MGDQPERWDAVAEHLHLHMARTGLGPSELARRAGISTNTLRELLNVVVHKRRRSTLSNLALALDLPGDYFDRVLIGEDPFLTDALMRLSDATEASRRTTNAVARHVLEFRPDLIITLDDGTQVIVEVKGGGKIREAAVLQEVTRLLRPLYPEPRPGHLGAADRAEAVADARFAIAAHGADAEAQTVDHRRGPAADAPAEQPD